MKNYKQAMNKVKMSDKCKNEILNRINSQENRRWSGLFRVNKVKFLNGMVLIFIIITILGGTITVLGKQNKGLFKGWLTNNEMVGDTVFDSSFCESDGHVRIEISEILSDIMNTKMVIHYTALDEEGRNWLKTTMSHEPYGNLHITPGIKDFNTIEYGVNYTGGCSELTEYGSDDEKYFEVNYSASGNDFGTRTAYLYYSMPAKSCLNIIDDCVSIELTDAIEMAEYNITSDFDNEINYIPKKIRISPLGIAIYGITKNVAISYKYGDSYNSFALEGAQIGSLYLILKDGSRYNLLESNELTSNGWCSIIINKDWNEETAKRWEKRYENMKKSGKFTLISDGSEGKDLLYSLTFGYTIDTDMIKSVEIDGTAFNLD